MADPPNVELSLVERLRDLKSTAESDHRTGDEAAARIEALEKALREAAATFRRYEQSHRAKARAHDISRAESQDRAEKAEANGDMAEMCERALSPAQPPPRKV